MKKVLTLMMVLVMLVTAFAGCAKDGSEAAEPADSQVVSETTDEQVEVVLEDVEFTAYFATTEDNWDKSKLNEIIAEKTGVSLDIEYLVGDAATKAGVLIAGGDYPDLIWGIEDHSKFIDAEALIDMQEMYEASNGNLKRIYGDDITKIINELGGLYHFPRDRGAVTIATESSGFYIQRKVLKWADYPQIKTLDEYFKLVADYAEAFPQTEDGLEAIGVLLLTDDWRDFTLQNTPLVASGYPNDGNVMVDQETYDVKVVALEDSTKEYLQLMNGLYLKGLVDEESFTLNYEQWVAAMVAGNVIAHGYNQNWQMGDVNNALRAAGRYDDMYVAVPAVATGVESDMYQWPGNMVVRDGIGISVNCEDPQRAFDYLDYLAGEEAQMLLHWGIEGETYEVADDGSFYRTDEQRANMKDEAYCEALGTGTGVASPWPQMKSWDYYTNGNVVDPSMDPDEVASSYEAYDIEFLKGYGVKTYSEMFAPPVESKYGVAWDVPTDPDSGAGEVVEKLRNIQRAAFPAMIMAEEGEFEALWNKYVEDVSALDLALYEDQIEKGILARVAVWEQLDSEQ